MSSAPLLLDLTGLDQERFQVSLTDTSGAVSARAEFAWRTETVAFEEDLKLLEDLALFPNPDAQFHKEFGQRLYRALFDGDVGTEYARRLAAVDSSLPLILRIDPQTAQPLTRLPWELLHDGQEFLALNPRTTISRLPHGVPLGAVGAAPGTLRLLVVVANPDDLPDEYRLDVEAERETILAATEKLQREGRLGVDFLEDASPEAIEDALADTRYHILHVTGHGDFDRQTKHGVLLLEDERGGTRRVSGPELVKTLRGSGLRLIVLSACRTATAAHRAAYRDLGSQLAADFPASLTMQYPVADVAATNFAEKLYRAVCRGDDLHTAVARARKALLTERGGPAAFATPVAYVSDPLCLRVDRAMPPETAPASGLLDFGLVPKMERGFVARGRELRQLRRKLADGDWTAAVIHGIGGIGKSALASRLALRLVESGVVGGVKVINCTPTLTADGVLTELCAFLNLAGDSRLNAVLHQPLPLQAKTAVLAQALEAHSFLVIFDNLEDCLKKGRTVSRATQALPPPGAPAESVTPEITNPTDLTDPNLGKQLAQLAGSVTHRTRFLFTSRVDFEPVERGRIGDRIGHVGLGELSFVAAAQLMNRRGSLANLPVVSKPGVITKRYLYEKLGGHPWALDQFARRAEQLPIQEAVDTVEGLRGELLAFTLIAQAVEELPERGKQLLRSAAVYEEPVPVEALAYLLGDDHDAMPEVGAEVRALLNWGLAAHPPGSGDYVVHTLVRDWARSQWSAEERAALLRRAAQYWLAVGRDSSSLVPELNAWHYLFAAGEFEQAGQIVGMAVEYLVRWGQMELVLRLLGESVRTLGGSSRAAARGNLATVYQMLGDYGSARREHEAVLEEFRAVGDRSNEATALHQLGMLHQAQGEYGRARELYEQALAISQEIGDRASVAGSLHQLGNLHYLQGEYEQARGRYEQSLAIKQEVGDRAGVATSLHQLGVLHQLQGEYGRARERYEQSLVILQEIGDRAGVASSLHQLGILHQLQGEYGRAGEFCEQSLAIKQEIGNRAGVAISLHQLGVLHQLQGEYGRARERYEQSLAIAQEIGDRAGVASTLHQLGMLHQAQREYGQARERYEQALAITQEIGDRAGVAISLHQLGMLHQLQGEYGQAGEHYEQSLAIKQEIGDRAGVASSLGQIGLLLEQEGDLAAAVPPLAQAFLIFRQLGAPELQTAGGALARLRETMGEEAFAEAWQAMDSADMTALSGAEDKGMTVEQAMEVVVVNTVAVLTDSPEQKQEWLEVLGEWQAGLREQGLEAPSVFLGVVEQLVGGADPGILEAQVPTELREAWESITRGISKRTE